MRCPPQPATSALRDQSVKSLAKKSLVERVRSLRHARPARLCATRVTQVATQANAGCCTESRPVASRPRNVELMRRTSRGGDVKVPGQRYDFSESDVEAVASEFSRLLRDGDFLTQGRYVEEFEKSFAVRHGVREAVAVSSGSAALEAILLALDVAGGEVIIPTNTFAATAFAVIRAGARPVLADILDDLSLDPIDVERCLSPATRAVITVHIGGRISPATRDLAELCATNEISLVEDAAHAAGAMLAGMAAGGFGVAAAFSFFSTKVITTGEGGMIATSESSIADFARHVRDQAKVDNSNVHDMIGNNWRMTEFQAILGSRQLGRLNEFIAGRRRVAEIYRRLVTDEMFRWPEIPKDGGLNFYKDPVFIRGVSPSDVGAALLENGISLSGFVYDVPLHRQGLFAEFSEAPLQAADRLCASHVCLPIYPSLTDEAAEYVATVLSGAVGSRFDG